MTVLATNPAPADNPATPEIPAFLELEITQFCQLKCTHCYCRQRTQGRTRHHDARGLGAPHGPGRRDRRRGPCSSSAASRPWTPTAPPRPARPRHRAERGHLHQPGPRHPRDVGAVQPSPACQSGSPGTPPTPPSTPRSPAAGPATPDPRQHRRGRQARHPPATPESWRSCEGQDIDAAIAELRALGVTSIHADRARGVGRAANGAAPVSLRTVRPVRERPRRDRDRTASSPPASSAASSSRATSRTRRWPASSPASAGGDLAPCPSRTPA